jgi:hypothetical protein
VLNHEPAVVPVTIAGSTFAPEPVVASVGDTVTWTNTDSIPHDVYGPAGLDSPMLSGGEGYSWVPTEAGTFTYVCTIHEAMVGTVTVVEHPPEEEPVAPVVDETTAPPVTSEVPAVAPVSAAAPVVAPIVATPAAVVDAGPAFHVELAFVGVVLLTFALVAVLLGVLPKRA